MSGVGTRSRLDVEDAHLEDIARLGTADEDGAGADMDAEPFAGAAAENRRLHGAGAAAIDVLLVLVPVGSSGMRPACAMTASSLTEPLRLLV